MIRLTIKSNGKPIYIASENITAICDNKEGGAKVYSGVDFSLVTESPEEVARKVLEYRLAMIDYHHDIPSVKTKAMAELAKLAGLEE
jgi:hypothetical protein